MSDKYRTQNCGFLNLLEYGDTVLADRGFNISHYLVQHYSIIYKREVPTKPARSRMLSTVSKSSDSCRVMGQMKNKFTILQSVIPVSLVKRTDDETISTIDKIVTVCAALTNLSKSVVAP